MKLTRYLLLFLLTVMAVFPSCVREEESFNDSSENMLDGEKVVIDGQLSLPAIEDLACWNTKTFTEVPVVRHLYLVVFNDSDIIYEIVKAKPGTQSHPTNPLAGFNCGTKESGYLTPFHVELSSVAQGDRYIQFIASEHAIDELEEGTTEIVDEAAFVRSIETTGGDVVYWGRAHYTSITSTLKMTGIKMIRNFSKVTVADKTGDADDFELLGFKVFNAPVYGTIAPFNNSAADYIIVDGHDQINFNRFADYAGAASNERPYTYLNTFNGYHGFMPSIIEYDGLEDDYTASDDTIEWLDPGDPDYIYECSFRPDRNPFIILKGTYDGDTYYYKADFVYTEDNGDNTYYNLLRNFLFTLNISAVTGKGSATVYEAVNSIAMNNFEGSTMSQELTNIAIDDSRLYVSKTDILITSGTSFTMYVKSNKKDGEEEGFSLNDNSSITAEIRDVTSGSLIVTKDSDISISATDEVSGDYQGWRKVTVTVSDAANLNHGEVWKQPILFKNDSGLTRTVNLTLRRPMSLTVDMQDVVAGVMDTDCELKFSIPAGLTAFRFPMFFYIEQETNNLYPKALPEGNSKALSVESGPSNIPGRSGNAYYYQRTITWNEYQEAQTDISGIKTFSSWFKTLRAASATTVWVVPAPDNDYFYPYDDVENVYTNCDSFLNEKIDGELTFPYYGLQLAVGGQETITASGNSDGTITYSSSNPEVATVNSYGLVTGVSAGSATITASLNSTSSYTSTTASYQVSVTTSSLCGLVLSWNCEADHVVKTGQTLNNPSASIVVADGYDANNVTVTYSSSDVSVATVASNGHVTGVSAGEVIISATATAASIGGYAGFSRSITYKMTVVTDHPESGTVYHDENFIHPGFGDYTIINEKVTDGATYSAGTDVTSLFNTYTTYNDGTGEYPSRRVWYPYYNYSTGDGFGATASGYGSTEESTTTWDSEQGKYVTDYHNKYYASHAQLISRVIDLSCSAGATLSFYHAGNYFYNTQTYEDIAEAQTIMAGDCKVYISNNGGSTWTEATVNFYPSGSNWVYIRTSVDIPAAYCTSQFRLKFDYTSTNARAGTWEIKNVLIKEN